MKLLVGLGNPGARYARHRHNVGFMAADALMARLGVAPSRKRFSGEVAEGTLGGEKVLILKPLTFMNESGRSVAEAMRFYKLQPADVYVFHDELDLEAGKVRVKLGGGVAGHNGLRSIARHIGPDFWRVRIGIGHPGAKHLVQNHVLGNFAKADAAWLGPLIDAMADNAALLAAGDASNFMNRVALASRGGPAPSPAKAPSPRPAKPRRPRPTSGPSQRDLARAAAEPASAKRRAGKPAEAEPAPAPSPRQGEGETKGPLAAALSRIFGRKPGA